MTESDRRWYDAKARERARWLEWRAFAAFLRRSGADAPHRRFVMHSRNRMAQRLTNHWPRDWQ